MRHDVCYRLGKTGKSRSFDLMLPTIAKNARRVADYGASLGIRTCSENHGFIAQDSDRVERLFNAVAHDNYGLLVDVGNFLCVDEDPLQAVSRLAPYAVHAHVKDFKYNDTPTGIQTRGCRFISGTVIGEGVVPVGQCLAILARAGYDGFVSIEYEGEEDCIEGISRGLENLKTLLP
jgi:sugar phosphate isomerase/epimerase